MSDGCRSCAAPIAWAVTVKGRRMPLDRDPVADGNVTVDGPLDGPSPPMATVHPAGQVPLDDGDGARYVSHFATCPNAGQHRRRPAGRHR